MEIADFYGCTEGHAKDVGSKLWKLLSKVMRQKITKSNCRRVLEKCFRKAGTISGLFDYQIKSHDSSFEIPPTPLQEGGLCLKEAKQENINFIGRNDAIDRIDHLVNLGSKVIVIQGEGGLGKTTLAQQYLHSQEFDVVLELLMAKETQNITSAQRVLEEWLKYDLAQEPGLEFGVMSHSLSLLVVCHVYQENEEVIRIFSARRANKKEQRLGVALLEDVRSRFFISVRYTNNYN